MPNGWGSNGSGPSSAPDAGSWRVEHLRGTAGQLHHLDEPVERCVRVLEVVAPALVLGSTQPEDSVDRTALRAAGLDLVRRRSGGGAVLLVPGEQLWLDVVVPSTDALWERDVGRASWWLGSAWVAAVAAAADPAAGPAVTRLEVHRQGVSDRVHGSVVCFAGMGPGEVARGDRKLVGISQRRTRHAARFQCLVHRVFDAESTWSLLAPPLRTPELLQVLTDRVTDLEHLGVDPGWSGVEGLLAQLP